MNLNELRDKAYKCACDHGFHDKQFPDKHWLMLVITELSEMVNADRHKRYANVGAFKKCDTINDFDFKDKFQMFIKDSVEDEMADVVIRLLDLAGLRDISLNRITEERIVKAIAVLAEQKEICASYTLFTFDLSDILTDDESMEVIVITAVGMLLAYARLVHIDLEWHIEQKMRYNETRPMLNGKSY